MHMQPLRGVPTTDNVQLLQNDGMLEADSGCRSQSSNQESPKSTVCQLKLKYENQIGF